MHQTISKPPNTSSSYVHNIMRVILDLRFLAAAESESRETDAEKCERRWVRNRCGAGGADTRTRRRCQPPDVAGLRKEQTAVWIGRDEVAARAANDEFGQEMGRQVLFP